MKIVIVGGGFGGVKAALELANTDGAEVQLISAGASFEYHGALYRSATGHSPLEVVIRLGEIFAGKKNVEVVIDKITALNTKVKAVRGESGQTYPYDNLILAMGNEKNFFGIDGLDKYAHTMYTIRDTIELRNELKKVFSLPHRNNVRVIVIGAGPSGVELAGELQNFANLVAEKYGHKPKRVGVDLIEGADRVLPVLSPKVSAKALKRLQKLGVNVLLTRKVLKCSANSIVTDQGELAADVIIWTAGSRSVDFYGKYPEIFELERGKVKLDEFLQVPKAPDIMVVGDNAFTKFSGMAQTAIYDGAFVARNIKRRLSRKDKVAYKVRQPIYVVPIGGKWAVSQINGRVRSGRYGWMVRRKADLWIFKNFETMKKAYKTWRRGERQARF